MSIKKLFGHTDENTNYLADTNEKNLFKSVESAKNAHALLNKQQEFNPQINYSKPESFARYGSARLYYSGAVGRLLDYYPYDGSEAELTEFYNKSLGVERYVFDNLWPRANGYANFNSASYIDFRGGPHTITSSTTAGLFKDEETARRSFANVYDENIYLTEGLPNSYGTGSRESNLRANFDSGVTVEFWLKSKDIASNANSVIFDMWNNNASGSIDMGRMTIEILSASSASPFVFTVQSGTMTSGGKGSGSIFQQSIGQNILSTGLDDWKHYAFVFKNSGNDFVTELYINGYQNHTVTNSSLKIGELPSKDMLARIGSFVTADFKGDGTASSRAAGTHTFTGSIDEFRYWKEARNAEDIGKNWWHQVRGGANSDISNATLGVYYKFNEGTSNISSLDSSVLDYSGRISNGVWTGTPSRTLSSAMIEASASTFEYKDPIIYALHPSVVQLKQNLHNSGSYHDRQNNTNFYSYIPSWIAEEHDQIGNENPEIISHIMGTYFDKAYAMISSMPTFKGLQNTSASYDPLSFAQHLPESLGLNTPELFIESDVLNTFLNMTEDFEFSGDLAKTKNLIYQNLYNNLAHIYKSKGTEKAIKNVLRCFYLDDSLIKFKTYADNTVYDLNTNSVQILKNKNMLQFNTGSNIGAVCYLRQDPDDSSNSRGFISGSGDSSAGGFSYENGYGFTAEANVRVPRFDIATDSVPRSQIPKSSIFGIYSASVESKGNTKWMFDNGGADFQVYLNRSAGGSKSAYYSLTSSFLPTYELTSSIFFDIYDNSDWNVSVRLKPNTFPLATFVSGNTTNYTYDLIFEGINANLSVVTDRFYLTASVSKAVGDRFLNSAKRVYAGANRTNMTGNLNCRSDVIIADVRYWTKFIDSDSLLQHALDFDNVGVSGSFRNIAPYAPNNTPHEMLNRDTLALHWNFNDLTSSDGTGNFFTQDMSSGSADDGKNNGWLGGIAGYLHKGYGFGFPANSTAIKNRQQVNSFKFIEPEQAISSDMINILSNDDEVYGFSSTMPNFYNTLEKSMYDVISDEMLTFFAGAIDFHNLIGEPVNRYRERYKAMEHLRRLFFKKVSETKEVEKFVDYYKWFDDAISSIVAQLVPAASKFTNNLLNVVESHVLERNKYKSMFPTMEFKQEDPITPMLGIRERLYQWTDNHHPITSQATENPDWWRDRAERVNNPTIAAGDSAVDGARDIYRDAIANDNNQKKERLDTINQGSYLRTPYIKRKLSRPYKFNVIAESDYLTSFSPMKTIKGGTNFRHVKKIDYVYNALRPAGRVVTANSVFIPENVLFSQLLDTDGTLKNLIRPSRFKRSQTYGPDAHSNDQLYRNRLSEKVMITTQVRHGRDGTGTGYQSFKSLMAFPFNIVSSSVTTGYNKQVVERVTGNIEITNLHHDVYGDDMEKPMQTSFTEYAVGGHQSRHIALNVGTDNEKTRPEAWKIYLGYPTGPDCTGDGNASGALAMVGPDYPQPNAQWEPGSGSAARLLPYPATASQKAPWYRDFTAKRPVNIKNIKITTGSGTTTVLGNYRNNYEVVQTVGAFSNPIGFRDKQPKLPSKVFNPSLPKTHQATQVRTLLDIYRGAMSGGLQNTETGSAIVYGSMPHSDFSGDYSTSYLTGTKSHSVIIQRFSHRGGIEVDSRGYQDFRSTEFSVYNNINYRNLTVKRPFQNFPTLSRSAEPNGIRVYDIHGNDFGFYAHAMRPAGRFFRDSFLQTDPGASYDQLPAFHRVHRNNMSLPRIQTETFTYAVEPPFLNNENYARTAAATSSNSFLLTGSTQRSNFENFFMSALTGAGGAGRTSATAGQGGSGISWAGWVKFREDGTSYTNDETLWGFGIRQGDIPLMRLVKETEPTIADGVNWYLILDTTNNNTSSPTPQTITYKWNVKNVDFSGSWNHIALVWGSPKNRTTIAQAPVGVGSNGDGTFPSIVDGGTLATSDSGSTFYINGMSQSYESFTGNNGHLYELRMASAGFTKYKGFSNLHIQQAQKNQSAFIGGKWSQGATANDALSADVDEWSFWTVALDSGSIQELYNRGAPCDITASTLYENSGTFLFDWLRFENAADNNAFVSDLTNPGVYSSNNKLIGHTNSSSWMPIGNAGAGNWTISNVSSPTPHTGCAGTTILCHDITYTCDVTSDNLNVSHPIPRSDRQYSFFTGAIADPDPCNFRYSGYMPVFGPAQGMYKSSSTKYEVWLPLISGSDFGVYNSSTAIPRRLGAVKKWISDTANTSEGRAYKDGFTPQDFAGLNTLIYDPIDSATNVLGYSPSGALFSPAGTPQFENAFEVPHYTNRSYKGQNAFISSVLTDPMRGTVSGSGVGTGHAQWRDVQLQGYMFNALMLKRNGPYGYSTHAMVQRNRNHPVLRNERSASELSVYNTNTNQLENYSLPVISMRGRPAIINYSPYSPLGEDGMSVTRRNKVNDSISIKVTDTNEKIMFNSIKLNDYARFQPSEVLTGLDHLLVVLKNNNNFGLNYMIYTENIHPSRRNEFVSSSRVRTNYDNQYWRDDRSARQDLGSRVAPSIGRKSAPNFFASGQTQVISQSSWPLDAQENFLTRTGSIVGSATTGAPWVLNQRPSRFKNGSNPRNRNYLRCGPFNGATDLTNPPEIAKQNPAGELQSNYMHAHYVGGFTHGRGSQYDGQFTFITCGGLYARKHMLGPFLSVTNPSGMKNRNTGSHGLVNLEAKPGMAVLTQSVFINSGEALWEAGEQAGILRIKDISSANEPTKMRIKFESYKSKPWYDSYQDFREDIRLLAKDYVVVPEFRISENMEDYVNHDVNAHNNANKFNTFEIPGTGITSASGSFYQEYLDSGKLEHFRAHGKKTPMTAKEIRVTVKAVKKFNPYKGFYPAQRTLDLVSQFSRSYGNSLFATRFRGENDGDGQDYEPVTVAGGNARPIYGPLFMPGILYNSIKSGLAVDYPVVVDNIKKGSARDYARLGFLSSPEGSVGGGVNTMNNATLNTHMIHSIGELQELNQNINGTHEEKQTSQGWLHNTPFWDKRLPFETILAPETSMMGGSIVDIEPHSSAAIDFSGSIIEADNDGLYTLMARNFFGETANFFLDGQDYTSIKSAPISDNKIVFKSGSTYGARLKLRRSLATSGSETTNDFYNPPHTRRSYRVDRDAWGNVGNYSAFSSTGGRFFDINGNTFVSGTTYPLPQDPIGAWYQLHASSSQMDTANKPTENDVVRESFTMYSRPTAFGPPVSGRILDDADAACSASMSGSKDSLDGYNWSFTPPYYHGESWIDLIFRPDKSVYTLEEVFGEIETQCWRVDPGPVVAISGSPAETATTAFITSSALKPCIYDGRNVNAQAMQVTASVNILGIEKEKFLETDQFGNPTAERNQSVGTRWVIKPKFETPMLNFNSKFRRTDQMDGTVTLPLFGSASAPIGMWHQFGVIEPDRKTGIFMEINDIPKNWLKYHYMVQHTASVYNNYNPDTAGEFANNSIPQEMRSLTDIFKFDKTPKKLGQLANRKIVKEAVVAIPFRITTPMIIDNSDATNLSVKPKKEFFGLEPFRVAAALASNANTPMGKSLEVAGESIRKLVRKMKKYILPPQFDFLRNPEVPPMAMYILEFSHEFDKDDLSYMWQNLAPRNYKKLEFEESSIAHELNRTELLNAEDLLHEDVQWMIFKVKQKATGDYFTHVASQVSTENEQLTDIAKQSLQYNLDFIQNKISDDEGNGLILKNKYDLQYNWPYDYLSIVEGIKVDVQIMYDDKVVRTGNLIAEHADSTVKDAFEKSTVEIEDSTQVANNYASAQYKKASVEIAEQILGESLSSENVIATAQTAMKKVEN